MINKNILDFWKSLYSRKLMVFVVATILLCIGRITQDVWVYVGLAYMGTNLVQKYIEKNQIKTKLSEEPKEEGSA